MTEIIQRVVCYGTFIVGAVLLIASKIELPRQLMFPDPKKFKVDNEAEYLKSKKLIFSIIGIYYMSLGVVLIFKIAEFNSSALALAAGGVIIMIFEAFINKKHYVLVKK